MTYKSIPTIVCGEKSYGWDIPAGDTRCAHCGSERTVRVDEKRMKHTPGPWKAQIVAGSIWGIYTEHLSPMLAKLPGAHENNKANARLIAAAPDLLEALIGLRVLPGGYCFCYHNDRDPQKPEDEHTGECQAARAAIRKAGEG